MLSRRRAQILRRRSVWSILGLLAAVAVAQIVYSLANNTKIHYSAIRKYVFAPVILKGVVVTIELTVISMVVGIVLGVILALLRLSQIRVLRWLAGLYIWFFRGSPVLVQLIFWFNLGLMFSTISIGVPWGPTFASTATNSVISGFTAALLGLGLNEGAYMAEIVRSGVLAVNRGQAEAARALGMSPIQVMRIVVLPQAMRVAIPPTGNQLINMLKVTSLVSVVGGGDLLTHAQNIASTNFYVIELLSVATLWYLLLTSFATVGQSALERRLAHANRTKSAPADPHQEVLGATVNTA